MALPSHISASSGNVAVCNDVALCRRMLAEWFSIGTLQLEHITWEKTSAALLEKVCIC
jgi:hypothetical protein